ncbi:MAG: class I SAM-dependent methyltransferase [Chlamydiales bacterium]
MRVLMFFVPLLFAFSQADLPEPYNSVELLPYDPHGWYGNASQMKRVIEGSHIKTVVEVGSWLGQSTRHIASLLPEDGKVYAVDHWLGSVEHQPGQSAWHPALPQLYQQFLSNVIHAGMADKIIPIRMSSLEAAQELAQRGLQVDMVYLDAGHEKEVVYADLWAWYPFVQDHGVMCGDDWEWRSVRKAVQEFAKQRGLKVKAKGNFWIFVK